MKYGKFVENMLQLHGLTPSKIKHTHCKFSKTVVFYSSKCSIGTVLSQKDKKKEAHWPKLAEITQNYTLPPLILNNAKKKDNSKIDQLQVKIILKYNSAHLYSSVSSFLISIIPNHQYHPLSSLIISIIPNHKYQYQP